LARRGRGLWGGGREIGVVAIPVIVIATAVVLVVIVAVVFLVVTVLVVVLIEIAEAPVVIEIVAVIAAVNEWMATKAKKGRLRMPCRVERKRVPRPFAAELVPWLEFVLVLVVVLAVATASAAVVVEVTMIAVGHGPESRDNDTSW